MDEFLLRLAKDFGFPAIVAAYVLIRLDRRLAHVETCLVRICAILSATTGVRVEELDPDLAREAGEPQVVQPVPSVGNAALVEGGDATAGVAKQGG